MSKYCGGLIETEVCKPHPVIQAQVQFMEFYYFVGYFCLLYFKKCIYVYICIFGMSQKEKVPKPWLNLRTFIYSCILFTSLFEISAVNKFAWEMTSVVSFQGEIGINRV